jgi:hypothetical protein
MKKLIAILAVLMLVPFTAFGLEALSEDVLDDVTGQAGVSINLSVSIASVTMDTLAWGDSDGVGTSTDAGWVGLSNFSMTGIQVHPRADWVFGTDASKALLQFVTIDVATDPTGVLYDGATYVHINPGTLEIMVADMTTDVALGADAAAGLNQTLGSVGMSNLLVRLNQDNFIDIYSGQSVAATALGTTGSGVTMTFQFNVDVLSMDSLTWGDSDGVVDGGVTTGGTVGLYDFVIDDMTVTGTVTIDVATIGAGVACVGMPTSNAQIWSNVVYIYGLLNANNPGTTSDSFVHIGLNDIDVTIATMTTNVGFSNAATDTLGSIYASNIAITDINGFVDIFAH